MNEQNTEARADSLADYVLTLTPKQAALVAWMGRYMRKQEGFWDDPEWSDDQTSSAVWTMFEALHNDYKAAQADGLGVSSD